MRYAMEGGVREVMGTEKTGSSGSRGSEKK